MNSFWGGGSPQVAPPSSGSVSSPRHQSVCDEARAAAAWVWIQSEVAGAFERFSKELLAIHARGLGAVTTLDASRLRDAAALSGSVTSSKAAAELGGGARDALNSLLLLCAETGAEANRFASALATGVVKPVDEALQPLAQAADRAGGASLDPTGFAAAGDPDVQKAARRLQLAEEELTKAEASLQELRALFGAEINSSLEQKATERISRASRLKCAAQESLQQAVAASAAKQAQGSTSMRAPHLPASSELAGSARLLVASGGLKWAEAGGLRAEEHHRRVASAMLQSMKAAGKAALGSQQRSTGFVLHYVKDMQLFAAAEMAAAGAYGGPQAESGGPDIFLPGASDDLMRQLYPPNSGAQAASQQQTNEATLRNLLRHQEKQLQEMLKERDELRRQTAQQQKEAERQQREIERQQEELLALKQQRHYEASAAGAQPSQPVQEAARPKLRKQVTIHLSESEDENTPWSPQQLHRRQGGDRGESHGRAEGGGSNNAADLALRLPAVNAGDAREGEAPVRGPLSRVSPPAAAGSRRPIEMTWVDVELRYEAFLLSLRSLPLSSLMSQTNAKHHQYSLQEQQQQQQEGDGGSELRGPSWGSRSASPRGDGGPLSVRGAGGPLSWADPCCAAALAEAIEAAADAALPSFLVRCCRLAAAAASPSSRGDRQSPTRAGKASRMSVQQVQGRIQWSKRQQQQQQQDEASGRPLGPLDWTESDLQVLAYELLLLVVYHHSQYTAAAALLLDEEDAQRSNTSPSHADPSRINSQQQQQQQQKAGGSLRPSRQIRRPRKSLARAMSFRRGMQADEEEEPKQQQQQQQQQQRQQQQPAEESCHADGEGPAAEAPGQQLPVTNGATRIPRKPRKSLARAVSMKLGVFLGDEDDLQQQQNQQQQQQQGQGVEVSDAGECWGGKAAEGPSVDLLGPCHPFSLPFEEWQRRLADEGARVSLPLRRRLHATQQWLAPSPLLQQANEDVLMQLLQLARVCFELPSASSNKLLSLLTPQVDCGLGPGASLPTFLHPCDLRFRVCRLMDAWRVALSPPAAGLKPPAPPRTQQQQQRQQQRNARFLPGAAGAIGRFDATQGMRGAIRRKAAGSATTSTDKKGRFAAVRGSHAKPPNKEVTSGVDAGGTSALSSGATKQQQQQQQQQQQLAGDLDPPLLLQPPQEKRKSKQRVSLATSLGRPSAAAATASPPSPPPAAEESQKRQDPVFQAFVQRQLQLLHAAALSRCARLLKFLLPEGKAAPGSDAAADSRGGPQGPQVPLHALAWRPVQLQQLYARERSCSDEEAFLFFLRSLLLCQDEAANPQRAQQAPAFLLYSKEETANAIAAAAQLQLLPLRLLCCFYHIFAYIFALQQLHRQQLWGEEEAFVSIEELSIRVTDYAGAPAGTGEAEPPLTWEVRTEMRERGGLQLLQLLQHNMSQAATLDAALRCSLAARGSNNPTLKRLAASSSVSGREASGTQRLRRQQSLKPVANLLELPDPSSDFGDLTDVSEGGFLSGSEVEGPEKALGKPPLPGVLRSALRRPTLKALRRLTLHGLEGGAGASSVAGEDAAGASVFQGGEQQSLCLPREMQLSAYWCMDVPLLLCLLLLLGKCCVDPTAANGLQLDAPSLVQGLLLVAHAAQVGTDPTCPSVDEEVATNAPPPSTSGNGAPSSPPLVLLQAARAGSGFPGVSLESVALLVAACVWGTAAGGASGLPSQHQQHQLLQHSAATSGSPKSVEPPLQQQGSVHSTGSPNTGRSAAAALQQQQQQRQQQQLLEQLAVPLVPSAVHPMGAEVVTSAKELLTDFCGFLKRPSADAEAEADEVAWLLGGPQAAADALPSDPATATTTTSAAAAANAAAAPLGGAGGTPAAGDASKAEWLAGGGGAPLTPPHSTRIPTLKRQPTGAFAAAQSKLEQQRPGGGSTAAQGDNKDAAAAGLDPGELLLRVRGERLALCLRPSLFPQGEGGAADEEHGLWVQPTATFSGLLTRRLWLAPDWWVSNASGRGVSDQQCGLRNSRSASFCYGLSALLPSRVELQQQEIASLQLLCSGFLVRLQQQLQDYRRHFEPQVLYLALCAWRSVAQRLLLLPVDEQQDAKRGSSARGVGFAWPGAPESWTLQVLEALRRSVMAAGSQSGDNRLLQQDETEVDEEFAGDRERSDSAEDNMAWVWSLPEVLRGPSPLHDMLRCFISRSLFAAAGRLLGPHVFKLLQLSGAGDKQAARGEGAAMDRQGGALTGTEDAGSEGGNGMGGLPAASGGEAEAAEDEVLRGLAGGIEALRSHVQSELLLYSEVFMPLLPLRGEHALLVLGAAEAVLLSVVPLILVCVDRAAEADDDDKRGLPARGGSAVLNALAAFERLTDELCLGGVLSVCLSTKSQRQQRGLVSALAPRLFASFSLHLSGLTDLLSQAFLKDVFAPANPPHALYSEKAVDGWCCIYGVVEAALDSSLPVRWLLPRLLQFLSELTAGLCRSLTDPCMSQSEGPGAWGGRPLLPLLALRQLQQASFSGLLEARGQAATIAEAPLVEHFLALHRTLVERNAKQHRASKGWRGRMTQLVTGWEEEEKASMGAARFGSAYLSNMEGENSGDSSDEYEKPLPAQGGTARGHAGGHSSATDEDRGRSRSVFRRFFGPTGSRESSLARTGGGGHGRGDAEAAVSSGSRGGPSGGPPRNTAGGMERLSQPVLQLLAAVDTLTEWEAAREKAILTGGQRPTSGLQRWLVRLHIVSLYLQRLPGLRTKLLEEAQKRIVVRCPRDVDVVRRLRQLQGLTPGGGPSDNTNEGGGGGLSAIRGGPKDALQRRQEEELAEATAAIDDAIESLTQKLQETAKEICSLAAMHLVYYELQGDLFGSLYAGEDGFNGMNLSRMLQAFPNTVEAFFCSAPVESQDDLASAVLLCLVEAWCLLLTEWGYGGHMFEEKELEVLEADLDAVRNYAADNEIALEADGGVLDRVNDFLVMLDADGRCLAAAGHLSRQQQESPKQPPPPIDAQDRSRYSTTLGLGRGSQPTAPLFTGGESAPEVDTPGTRRSRHRGREALTESSDKGSGSRRHRSRSKGWGGVGRWVRGVYGHHSSSHRDSSRASHRTSTHAHRDEVNNNIIPGDPRESPRRSLRFAV